MQSIVLLLSEFLLFYALVFTLTHFLHPAQRKSMNTNESFFQLIKLLDLDCHFINH